MEIRPRAPKNEIYQNYFIFVERPPDFASNEPSTTPNTKFKSSYARKRDFAQIWKFGPRLPKMEFFKKNFIFLKKSSNFASNEPSTTCGHKVKVKLCKKTLSKKLNLGLNFSPPSGGVTSPSFKGSMVGDLIYV